MPDDPELLLTCGFISLNKWPLRPPFVLEARLAWQTSPTCHPTVHAIRLSGVHDVINCAFSMSQSLGPIVL